MCLPKLLRAEGIESAFYTTSKLGYQSMLGFDTLWSTVASNATNAEAQNVPTGRKAGEGGISWPPRWWTARHKRTMRRAPQMTYNWLGHHDVYGLPAIRDFIDSRNASGRRFFLQLLTLGTHAPFVGGECPLRFGGARHPNRPRAQWKLPRPPPPRGQGVEPIPPPPGSSSVREPKKAQARQNFRRYLKELHCADRYVQEVHGILARAGRLVDTSIIVTADHGEGFQISHSTDVVHGGSVYDSQSRVPFLVFGPMAKGLPKLIRGAWSDTLVTPTLLEALGAKPHPTLARAAATSDPGAQHLKPRRAAAAEASTGGSIAGVEAAAAVAARPEAVAARPEAVAARPEAVAELGLADLYGRSVYAHCRTPPRQAFMSCAFDATCLGLYSNGTKYILQLSTGVLESYRPDPDELEEHDTASTLPAATRNRVSGMMRAWQHAVQELHPRVSSATSCPYEAPFAIRKWSPVRTHCCSAPEVRIPEGMYQAWMIGRTHRVPPKPIPIPIPIPVPIPIPIPIHIPIPIPVPIPIPISKP